MDAQVRPPHLKQVFEDTTRPKRPVLAQLLHLPSDVRSKVGNSGGMYIVKSANTPWQSPMATNPYQRLS